MNLSDENIVAKVKEGDRKKVSLSKALASNAANAELKAEAGRY